MQVKWLCLRWSVRKTRPNYCATAVEGKVHAV
jgi:hypothetical protein